ncbi:Exosortase [Candidatus Nanobsidianus stetteri]|uniref:Exosortase n=1 Tax=Nanobsidianus stetteri TaxID=1294122 RepID=R1E4Z8_NANST|nr:Exosortase [Candidatus Nanobsidianus stetteri]
MFEYIIKKYYSRLIDYAKRNKLLRKELILSIFFINMLIYSIPLFLFSYYYIVLPYNFLINYSEIISKILYYSHINFTLENNVVYIKNISFIIDQECTGFKSIFGIFALIFSTPILNIKKKIYYFIIFSPILFILNIFRLWSVFYFYYIFNINPYFLHNFLWEIFTTLFLIIFWLIFLIKNKKELFV